VIVVEMDLPEEVGEELRRQSMVTKRYIHPSRADISPSLFGDG
jgi:hypothetical protein